MSTIADTNSLFEIDTELDGLLNAIEEQTAQGGEPAEEIVARFQQFCSAHGEKVDRIGRFLRRMEAHEQFCRAEVVRLSDRARAAAGKVERTKNMVLYYLMSRELKSIEGREFTLRAQKNSQDSVRITGGFTTVGLSQDRCPHRRRPLGNRSCESSRRAWQNARELIGRVKTGH